MNVEFKAIPIIEGDLHSVALSDYTVVRGGKILVLSWTLMMWYSGPFSEENERINSQDLMKRVLGALLPAFKAERPEIERVIVELRYVPTLKHHLYNEDGSTEWDFVEDVEDITDGEITKAQLDEFLSTPESLIAASSIKYKDLLSDYGVDD